MQEYSLRQYALSYAKLGMAVFPIMQQSKKPATKNGFHDATVNIQQINKWWNANPSYNIGIATGKASNGIFVIDLDIDEDKGIHGVEELKEWERSNDLLPDTCQSITGRGGIHMFYRSDKYIQCRINILHGIDIRGDGGYIVAPPSIHENGQVYEWEQAPDEFKIVDVNETIYKFLAQGSSSDNKGFKVGNEIKQGERNNVLFKMACSLQAKNFSDETIYIAVKSENVLRCTEPLGDQEVDIVVNSALRYMKGKEEGGETWKQNRLKELKAKRSRLLQQINPQ